MEEFKLSVQILFSHIKYVTENNTVEGREKFRAVSL